MMTLCTGYQLKAQSVEADTVIINFGNNSRIIFYIDSQEDLDQLRNYDLNQLAKDFSMKVENASGDEEVSEESGEKYLKDTTIIIRDPVKIIERERDNDIEKVREDDNEHATDDRVLVKHYSTKQFFNFDLGMNNYLEEGKFPDSYNANHSVRPWGSWYVSLGSMYKSHVDGSLFLEYGGSISWYNFKFEDSETRLFKDDINVSFINDTSGYNYKKSKLTATYLNVSFVPVLYFGDKKSFSGKSFWKQKYNKGFRIGLGAYGGYRIGSHAKYVYKQDGNKERDKDKDSFYLNNWRYGARLQVGFKGTDLFVNYDLNELFAEGKGPKLNAFSFGITL